MRSVIDIRGNGFMLLPFFILYMGIFLAKCGYISSTTIGGDKYEF